MSRLSYESIKSELDSENPDVFALQVEAETLIWWSLIWLNEDSPIGSLYSNRIKFVARLLSAMADKQTQLLEQLDISITAGYGKGIAGFMAAVSQLDQLIILAIFSSERNLFPKIYLSFITQDIFDVLMHHVQKNKNRKLLNLLVRVTKKSSLIEDDSRLLAYQSVSGLYDSIQQLRSQYDPNRDKVSFTKCKILSDVLLVLGKYKAGEWGFTAVKADLELYFSQLKMNTDKYDSVFSVFSRMRPIWADLQFIFKLVCPDLSSHVETIRSLCHSDFSRAEQYQNDVHEFLGYLDHHPEFIEIVLLANSGQKLLAMMAINVANRRFSEVLDVVDRFWLADGYKTLLLFGHKYSLLANTLLSLSRLNDTDRRFHFFNQLISANADRILKSIQKLPPRYQLGILVSRPEGRRTILLASRYCPKLLPDILRTVLSALNQLKSRFERGLFDVCKIVDAVFGGDIYSEMSHAILLRYVYEGGEQGMKICPKLPKTTDFQKGLNLIYRTLLDLSKYKSALNKHSNVAQRLHRIYGALESLLRLKSGEEQKQDPVGILFGEVERPANRSSSDLGRSLSAVRGILEKLDCQRPSVAAVSVYAGGANAKSQNTMRVNASNSLLEQVREGLQVNLVTAV